MKVIFNFTGNVGVFHGVEGVTAVKDGEVRDVTAKIAEAWVRDGVAKPYEGEEEKSEPSVDNINSLEDAENNIEIGYRDMITALPNKPSKFAPKSRSKEDVEAAYAVYMEHLANEAE